MGKKITHDEYTDRVHRINPNLNIIGKYTIGTDYIDIECNICGYKWKPQARKLIEGMGKCPNCHKISRTKTHDVFLNEMKSVNSDIEILCKYVNAHSKVKCRCKIDNNIWYSEPSHLLSGKGCPKCAGNYRRTHEEFIKDLCLINNNIEVLNKYKGVHRKIKCKCKIDGHIWYTEANLLLRGTGCPKCAGNIKSNTKEFSDKVKVLTSNEYTVIGEYVGAHTPIKILHEICDTEYCVSPANFISGRRCPHCNISKGEKRIEEYLNSSNIDFIPQMEYDGLLGVNDGQLSYDFYLPTYNLLIEYQGQYHDGTAGNQTEEQFKIQQEHDKRKRKYALDKNIKLLEIWYWDFDNIEEILNKELNL